MVSTRYRFSYLSISSSEPATPGLASLPRNQIEISAFDEQALNEIASDFAQKIAPLEAQERALVAAFHKQYPPAISPDPLHRRRLS